KDVRKYQKDSGLNDAKKDLASWKSIENNINEMIETFKTVLPDDYDYLNSLPVNININYNPSISPYGADNPQSTLIPVIRSIHRYADSGVESTVWSGNFKGDIEITLWGGGNFNPFQTNFLA